MPVPEVGPEVILGTFGTLIICVANLSSAQVRRDFFFVRGMAPWPRSARPAGRVGGEIPAARSAYPSSASLGASHFVGTARRGAREFK